MTHLLGRMSPCSRLGLIAAVSPDVNKVRRALCAFLIFLGFGWICSPPTKAQSIDLVDVTAESGIDWIHTDGGSGKGYIVEALSAGIATFDYNNDGWIDIYFLNGAPLRGTQSSDIPRNALFRNNGNFTFTDVTEEAGVGDTGYGLGVGVGDYDGDGNLDIYVNNFGPNVLYRNRGDQTFEDVTHQCGVADGEKVGAGVAFLDIDGDGDLDLYSANYVNFNYDTYVEIIVKGKRYTAGPQYYKPVPDTLFRNDGNGKFTDISQESGIASVAGSGMGLIALDIDDDHDTDIYVCNDGNPNFLFLNDGKGHFEEVALLSGLAFSFTGDADASMGVDVGDYNRDGLPDLFSTNYQGQAPNLYRNLSNGIYMDASRQASALQVLYPHVNWGTAFVDIDNDSDEDLFVACGHFDRIEQVDDRTSLKIPNFLFRNDNGVFKDVSTGSGSGLSVVESSRALAAEDFDNDGDIDLVVANADARPTVLRNDSAGGNHWMKLILQQDGPNRSATGAKITLAAGSLKQTRFAVSGRGYQSHFGTTHHFGLGTWDQPAIVTVSWPDGQSEVFEVPVDQLSTLVRGQGAR